MGRAGGLCFFLETASPFPFMAKSITIIGLDVALAATGAAVVDWRGRGKPELLEAITIRTKPQLTTPERLSQIAAAVKAQCVKFSPAVAAVEAGIVRHSGTTTRLLAQARGAVLLSLQQAGVPLIEDIHISQVKRAATGSGIASKPEVVAGVARLVKGAEQLAPDEADAVACALAAYDRIDHG